MCGVSEVPALKQGHETTSRRYVKVQQELNRKGNKDSQRTAPRLPEAMTSMSPRGEDRLGKGHRGMRLGEDLESIVLQIDWATPRHSIPTESLFYYFQTTTFGSRPSSL